MIMNASGYFGILAVVLLLLLVWREYTNYRLRQDLSSERYQNTILNAIHVALIMNNKELPEVHGTTTELPNNEWSAQAWISEEHLKYTHVSKGASVAFMGDNNEVLLEFNMEGIWHKGKLISDDLQTIVDLLSMIGNLHRQGKVTKL